MRNFVGILRLMSELPAWALFVGLYVVCVGVFPVGRMYFEGMPYNLSFASSVGDIFLFGIILIASDTLKSYVRSDSIVGWNFQAVLLVVCVAVSLLSWRLLPANMVMDRYHSVVVVPLLFFMLVVSAVVIYSQAASYQKVVSIMFFFVWLTFLILDSKLDLLDQQKWLTIRGLYPR